MCLKINIFHVHLCEKKNCPLQVNFKILPFSPKLKALLSFYICLWASPTGYFTPDLTTQEQEPMNPSANLGLPLKELLEQMDVPIANLLCLKCFSLGTIPPASKVWPLCFERRKRVWDFAVIQMWVIEGAQKAQREQSYLCIW